MLSVLSFNNKQENMTMSTQKNENIKDWQKRWEIIQKKFEETFGERCTYEKIQKHLGIGRGKMPPRVNSIDKWTVGDIKKISEALGFSLEWIVYGTGGQFDKKIAEKPVHEEKKEYKSKQEITQNSYLLEQCEVVLDSRTSYAQALASNIIAFYNAVRTEQNYDGLANRLDKIQREMDRIKSGRDNNDDQAVGGL